MSVENYTNEGAKVCVLLRANCSTNCFFFYYYNYILFIIIIFCYYNFNPGGISENMTSFTLIRNEELEQGKLMATLNSRK